MRELEIAAQNRFLPILMVPEAVQFRQQQQKRSMLLHQRRKHSPGVIRAAVPASDRISQRELLSVSDTAQNVSDMTDQRQLAREPSMFTMLFYGVVNLFLYVWYWLPTRQEVLLWISQYLPVADALCMDYFRIVLRNRTWVSPLTEIPLHALDQALHDAWLHRQ